MRIDPMGFLQTNLENSLKSGMTEAKILVCDDCNATVTDTGIGMTDPGTRVITIIEASDEADNNALMNSNSIFGGGGGGNDKRLKRGTEAAALAGNDTAVNDTTSTKGPGKTTDKGAGKGPGKTTDKGAGKAANKSAANKGAGKATGKGAAASLAEEMARANPSDPPKPVPIKRDADGVQPDMTQAIMEQRVDFDVDDEFLAANGHGYDAPRIRPANKYRGYSHRPYAEPADSDEHLEEADGDDFDDGGGDHNSHYEYVPMEFDEVGNHR